MAKRYLAVLVHQSTGERITIRRARWPLLWRWSKRRTATGFLTLPANNAAMLHVMLSVGLLIATPIGPEMMDGAMVIVPPTVSRSLVERLDQPLAPQPAQLLKVQPEASWAPIRRRRHGVMGWVVSSTASGVFFTLMWLIGRH